MIISERTNKEKDRSVMWVISNGGRGSPSKRKHFSVDLEDDRKHIKKRKFTSTRL